MNKLNLVAPINNLGYGIVGLNILKSLSSLIDIALFPIGNIDTTSHNANIIQEATANAQLFEGFSDAPCLKIWHEFSLADRIGRGQSFAFPFFEINKFDQKRINHLNSVDSIVVASSWASTVIKNHIPNIPVNVVPVGVDSSIFANISPTTTDKCIFFNCGKWEKRKGHDVLLEMFKQAFPTETNVELWMMCQNPFLQPKLHREWERYYASDSRVRLLNRVETQTELAAIMNQTNCGIFPSRAEGWNLELLEMMALGKHVIATNYSAHTEFCNNQNSKLIDIVDMEAAEDGVFFDGSGGEWASLDNSPMQQGVEHMKEFYEQWKTDHSIINEEGIQTAQKLTWTNTANKIEEVIYGSQSTKIKQELQTA